MRRFTHISGLLPDHLRIRLDEFNEDQDSDTEIAMNEVSQISNKGLRDHMMKEIAKVESKKDKFHSVGGGTLRQSWGKTPVFSKDGQEFEIVKGRDKSGTGFKVKGEKELYGSPWEAAKAFGQKNMTASERKKDDQAALKEAKASQARIKSAISGPKRR